MNKIARVGVLGIPQHALESDSIQNHSHKRDEFNFNIICLYSSQLIRYARASTNYYDLFQSLKYLQNQEYGEMRLKRSLAKFFLDVSPKLKNTQFLLK